MANDNRNPQQPARPQPIPAAPLPRAETSSDALPHPAAVVTAAPTHIIALSHTQQQIQAQATLGLRDVDDFPEGYWADEDRQHPREFPAEIGGKPVKYMTLPSERTYEPPYGEYASAGTPVTRQTVPGLPEGLFGVDGLVHAGTDIWYVFLKTTYDKIKARYRKRMEDNIKSIADSRYREDENGGGVFSGVKTAERVSA